MKFCLVNPAWRFEHSTYFGCPETHLPLEFLFARQHLQAAGHDVLLVDAHLEGLDPAAATRRVAAFAPDFLAVTTAPTYLFWRCPQPELTVPAAWLRTLRAALPGKVTTVAVGPHASATPRATGEKLGCDVVLRGECDLALAQLAAQPWEQIPGCCWRTAPGWRLDPRQAQVAMEQLTALDFHDYPLARRHHRHHVFSGAGRGAELEFSRGCPWNCTFCNKSLFRNKFRERTVEAVLQEAETLLRHGVTYVYFIDEIFGAGRRSAALLQGLADLPLQFGMQTRIDLWDEDSLAALGRAHCISLECGIESITPEGRERFRKGCRLPNQRLEHLLRIARTHIPWVQANLIAADPDQPDATPEAIARWRQELIAAGIWVSQPVPVFAFPGSPLYTQKFGIPDDLAWERAHDHYLAANAERNYSDIQDATPLPLVQLEKARKRSA